MLIEGIVGVQKEAVLAAKPSSPSRRSSSGLHAAQRGGVSRSGIGRQPWRGWSLAVVRPRLLPARQRLLHRLGRHRARPREVLRAGSSENVLEQPKLPARGGTRRRPPEPT